ncbi:hypothetical protein OG1X_1865 [Enterococcus faecalis OG1X]|nr:hypothetical protein OG1X_1865 [Enterococcus faecalis OG1X]
MAPCRGFQYWLHPPHTGRSGRTACTTADGSDNANSARR